MERIVIRPARASDAADLARNWIEGAQHHVELDPESFRVSSTDGLVEFFEESLKRPRSEDSVWLVAEVDGQVVGDVAMGAGTRCGVRHAGHLCREPVVGAVLRTRDGLAAALDCL
jgi:RimJ/RimL family protein N-acetyltransferase